MPQIRVGQRRWHASPGPFLSGRGVDAFLPPAKFQWTLGEKKHTAYLQYLYVFEKEAPRLGAGAPSFKMPAWKLNGLCYRFADLETP